jgi:hypothetical protein
VRPTSPAGFIVFRKTLAALTIRSKFSLPMIAAAGIAMISNPNRRMPLTTVFTLVGQPVAATSKVPAGMIKPRSNNAMPSFRRMLAFIARPPRSDVQARLPTRAECDTEIEVVGEHTMNAVSYVLRAAMLASVA